MTTDRRAPSDEATAVLDRDEREAMLAADPLTAGCRYARLRLGPHENFVYVIADPALGEAVCIDPAFDVPRILRLLDTWNTRLIGILHTHGHWDHIEGSRALADATGAPVYIHAADAQGIREKGGDPELLHGAERIALGDHTVKVHHTPGHTAGGITYQIDKRLFTGDLCFVEMSGRCDFPTGDKEEMWDSLQWLKEEFTNEHVICPGHDYGREPEITLGEAKGRNTALAHARLDDFAKEWFLEAY